ncbi:WYL domain-containing protein [Aerococcaceae bacterium zg-ZJ1578]|uniref:helix-turn-helix transcriptional regulator n=1 Tax=Aerococcaceae bacterium zg-252 TaxID=2796928 RepID=UPI001A2F4525|nr:WYL domain-containing protein [Aerococcaceae bacterium zg-1578]
MEVKPRILYLLKILQERTDEEHTLSTKQLIEILDKEYGIAAYRTTISKDIEALQQFGVDVIVIRSTQLQYYIGHREFDMFELKILIDAVESAKFITLNTTKQLITKIHSLTNTEQVYKLKRNNYFAEKVKMDNEQIYYSLDTINEAINNCKSISFQYFDYVGLKAKVLRNKGEALIISPYSIIASAEYYHVVGYSNEQEKIMSFRLDRMVSTPEISEKEYISAPNDFNISEYTKKEFYMYDGDPVEVDLRIDNSLVSTIIDYFGEDVTILAFDMESFRLKTTISVSDTFYGWVFGYAGKVQILGPENIKAGYRQMIMNTYKLLK